MEGYKLSQLLQSPHSYKFSAETMPSAIGFEISTYVNIEQMPTH